MVFMVVNPKRSAKKHPKSSKNLEIPGVFRYRLWGSNHLQRRCDWMFREGSPNCFRLIPPFGAFRYGARRSIRSFAQGFHQLGHALLHGRCTRRRRGQTRWPWLWLTCLGNNLEHLRGAKMNGKGCPLTTPTFRVILAINLLHRTVVVTPTIFPGTSPPWNSAHPVPKKVTPKTLHHGTPVKTAK